MEVLSTDDIISVVISYLNLTELFKLKLVNKQWQRVVGNIFKRMTIINDQICHGRQLSLFSSLKTFSGRLFASEQFIPASTLQHVVIHLVRGDCCFTVMKEEKQVTKVDMSKIASLFTRVCSLPQISQFKLYYDLDNGRIRKYLIYQAGESLESNINFKKEHLYDGEQPKVKLSYLRGIRTDALVEGKADSKRLRKEWLFSMVAAPVELHFKTPGFIEMNAFMKVGNITHNELRIFYSQVHISKRIPLQNTRRHLLPAGDYQYTYHGTKRTLNIVYLDD